jgi:hypothetical protein
MRIVRLYIEKTKHIGAFSRLRRLIGILSDWSVKAMTIDVFWQRLETALALAVNRSNCDICPVQQYAKETNTERICNKVGDCADGLKMLHRKLQEEEREKQDSLNELPW